MNITRGYAISPSDEGDTWIVTYYTEQVIAHGFETQTEAAAWFKDHLALMTDDFRSQSDTPN